MNRQERRAAQRRGSRHMLAGFQPYFTYDELALLVDALTLWAHQTRQDWEGVEMTAAQKWEIDRADKIRHGLKAALSNRPWRELPSQRTEPPP